MTSTAVVPATDPRIPEHLRGYGPEQYENCKGVLVPARVCATPGCMNRRWGSDTTGFCRPCKETKGMVAAKKGPPARTLSSSDPGWKTEQDRIEEQKSATLDDELALRIWKALPGETRLRLVDDAFAGMPRLVRLGLLRAIGVGAS